MRQGRNREATAKRRRRHGEAGLDAALTSVPPLRVGVPQANERKTGRQARRADSPPERSTCQNRTANTTTQTCATAKRSTRCLKRWPFFMETPRRLSAETSYTTSVDTTPSQRSTRQNPTAKPTTQTCIDHQTVNTRGLKRWHLNGRPALLTVDTPGPDRGRAQHMTASTVGRSRHADPGSSNRTDDPPSQRSTRPERTADTLHKRVPTAGRSRHPDPGSRNRTDDPPSQRSTRPERTADILHKRVSTGGRSRHADPIGRNRTDDPPPTVDTPGGGDGASPDRATPRPLRAATTARRHRPKLRWRGALGVDRGW